MADPLSITASIIAIIQLTGTVTKYLSNVKDSPEDRGRLLLEISNLSGLLSTLGKISEESTSDDSWRATIIQLSTPDGPLEQCRRFLQQLSTKLAPAAGLRKFGKSLLWPFQKAEILEILNRIERLKTIFGLALQTDHMCVPASCLLMFR